MYKAISPIYNIPKVEERKLPPQFITSASEDRVTPVHAIEEYVKALKDAGQEVTYWEYKDQRHAYLDSGKTFLSGNDFKRDAIPALKKIMNFLNSKLLKLLNFVINYILYLLTKFFSFSFIVIMKVCSN